MTQVITLRRLFLLALVLLGSWAISYASRDVTPPQVYAEVPEQVPAAELFYVELSADEPVTYDITYGELVMREVAQSYTLALMGQVGEVPLEITATDGSSNASSYTYKVLGLPPAEPPTITVPAEVQPGEPLSVQVDLSSDALPETLKVDVAGETKTPFIFDGKASVLSSVPLGSEPGRLNVHAEADDAYGRVSTADQTVTILPDPRPIQELNLSADTLSVITPEGRALERDTLDTAYARMVDFPTPQWTEPFVLPVTGRDTSGFGTPRRYAAGGNVSYHNGADIAAPAGTPILATNAGRVLVADIFPIKGGLVVIDHGAGLYSLYFHQSELHVQVGDRVAPGQLIGEVGSTGLSTGPHLHWEMRLNGVATNPLAWVGKVLP